MVEIKLGGEVRQLQFSHKAIKALKEHFGDKFDKVDTSSVEHLDVMVWACLLRYNKGIDQEDVEDMISDSLEDGELTYEELGKAIEKAVEESHIAKEVNANAKKKTVTKAKTKK